MTSARRVAFFTDSFHEVNGVALTSRQFEAFAHRREVPFLSVHAGPAVKLEQSGSVTRLELRRSVAAFNLESESELSFDPLIWRNYQQVTEALLEFRPDLIHVTGPGDFGMLAAYLSYALKIPFVASWHTNVHEYAARRLERLLSFVPPAPLKNLAEAAERSALSGTALFYGIASLLFAPNRELVDLLRQRTGKPCFLMQRGVDAELYNPAKRDSSNAPFTIGYVGRLSTEKNVRFLVEIERALLAAGVPPFRFLIVGAGAEMEWLAANLQHAEFTGVLKGEALAHAYARMDAFAFPSYTDTFGNVILEALASGVPAVVTSGGGPKFLVNSGVTGFVTADDRAFINCLRVLMSDEEVHRRMCIAAREHACSISWDCVFEKVYDAYASTIKPAGTSLKAAS